MHLRKADIHEIGRAEELILQAQAFLKKSGSDQWQNGYPNRESLLRDIENGESYVMLVDDCVVGTAMISFRGEPTYSVIEQGEWLTNEDSYAVVHRVAVDNTYKGQGLTRSLFDTVERMCLENGTRSVRVDTHEKNAPMQRILTQQGFTRCGIIYVSDGTPRLAYEKVL